MDITEAIIKEIYERLDKPDKPDAEIDFSSPRSLVYSKFVKTLGIETHLWASVHCFWRDPPEDNLITITINNNINGQYVAYDFEPANPKYNLEGLIKDVVAHVNATLNRIKPV